MSVYVAETRPDEQKKETPEQYWERRTEATDRVKQALCGQELTSLLIQLVNQGHYTLLADEILMFHADGFIDTKQALQLEELRQEVRAQELGRDAVRHFVEAA